MQSLKRWWRKYRNSSSETLPTDEPGSDDVRVWTDRNKLGSQGWEDLTSDDESISMIHESTVCEEYYLSRYGIAGGLNMDRGGYGQRQNGSNYACIFDGVSAGGQVNAHAAQLFTEYVLQAIQTNELQFTPNSEGQSNWKNFSKEVFCGAARSPCPDGIQADGGSATGALVHFEHLPEGKGAHLRGAAVGDAAVIIVQHSTGQAVQLNTVKRIGGDRRDTGGQITMGSGLFGEVETFEDIVECELNPVPYTRSCSTETRRHTTHADMWDSTERESTSFENKTSPNLTEALRQSTQGTDVHDPRSRAAAWVATGEAPSLPPVMGDLIILTTDGLTDNIRADDFVVVVPLIVRSCFFDGPDSPWTNPALPTFSELERLTSAHVGELDDIATINCEVASHRLFNYVQWVSTKTKEKESEYYAVEAQLQVLTRRISATPEAERKAVLATLQEEIDKLRKELDRLVEERNAVKQECKTDDCMIIAMRAYNALIPPKQRGRTSSY